MSRSRISPSLPPRCWLLYRSSLVVRRKTLSRFWYPPLSKWYCAELVEEFSDEWGRRQNLLDYSAHGIEDGIVVNRGQVVVDVLHLDVLLYLGFGFVLQV